MMVSHFLFFLAAITGAVSNLVFKKHVYVNTPMTWSVARDYCKQNHVDLSIINTLDEFNRFITHVAAYAGVRSWIGLSKKASETDYIQWCDGTVLSFTSWKLGEPSGIYDQHCITTQNNVWTDFYCDRPVPFFCYSEVILVEQKKTWGEAQKHCRTYYTDLFSVTTQTDLLVLNDIKLNIPTISFWTGLRFLNGLWFWVKQEPLGSLVSMPSCPNHPFLCGARNAAAETWENRDCREKMYFACLR